MGSNNNNDIYLQVLLPVPTEGIYTYKYITDVAIGVRASVPFGTRTMTGICLGVVKKPDFECKEIINILDKEPLFSGVWLDFLRRLADYYISPLGLALFGVISKKLLDSACPQNLTPPKTVKQERIELSAEQQEIAASISLGSYSAHLLDGITGSGKTEVYVSIIERALAEGKQALYIVPEIALTPQLIDRLKHRLGFDPALYHSKMSSKKRLENFWSFASGQSMLLLGARSALFVPSSNIGLIIVDEEHENTFKQEEMPPYNLRDMAVLYASMLNVPVVLGSATPQAESMDNALSGKYKLHKLRSRYASAAMPEITLVDMKRETLLGGVLAESVYDKLQQVLERGEQAILFLNRKGYATSLFCKQCGKPFECLNCSVPVASFKSSSDCVCHYCGEHYSNITCPHCGGKEFFDAGAGTERVEEFLEDMFPADVVRIDTGKITTIKQLDEALDKFNRKEAHILVGTQMVAKGLHFPNITFVGILGLDNIISLPDYRASERAYQLVMQVSGRAGRGDSKGNVYIQTYMPDNQLYQYFMQDSANFYEYELARRQKLGYPPYMKLARIVWTYTDASAIKNVADSIASALRATGNVEVLGAAPAVVFKIKNRYRFSLLVRAKTHNALKLALLNAVELFSKQKHGSMDMRIDRDPNYFM
ncbi:hypothetical protein RsTz2092_04230 [Deferribacterales bacterium RsTz2092]